MKSGPDSPAAKPATARAGPAGRPASQSQTMLATSPDAGRVRRRPSAQVASPSDRARARTDKKNRGQRVDSAAGRDRSVEGSKRRHPASLSPLSCPVGVRAEKAGEILYSTRPGGKETAASSSPVSLLRLQIPVLKDSQFLGPRPLLARLCLSIVACSRGDCKNSIFWFARLPDFLLSVSCRGAIFSPTCVPRFRLARLARHFPATSFRSLRHLSSGPR